MNEVNGKEKFEKSKITVKQSLSFQPLENVLNIDWTSEKYKKLLPSMDSSYFILKGIILLFIFCLIRTPLKVGRVCTSRYMWPNFMWY